GWIGKAISITSPDIISPAVSPDQIFVVVANIIASPGMFGFIMAALTAALMSTVDTLINATAAIYINDVHRPIRRFLQKSFSSVAETERKELLAARYASIVVTILGVLAVLAFKNFPTVYEAHGFFHSTLTPPLVVGIFLGVFWKRFTASAVITTFVGGVALMILGARFPGILIAPFDHGIEMNAVHPYSYIRALYNTLVCSGVAVGATLTTRWQISLISRIRAKANAKTIMNIMVGVAILLFTTVMFGVFGMSTQVIAALGVIVLLPLTVTYFVHYDEEANTLGLTASSITIARKQFKGSEPNDAESKTVLVHWKLTESDESFMRFSKREMSEMKAHPGDLVYISDKRAWLGGLKSAHSVYGEPHAEDGIVYLTPDLVEAGLLVKGRELRAEKEM
ncbi:MAG: sodium:solute symporter family protein, partial [Candidatus Marinimicrobia bacterium]|nr:sodium:solute symporter family protein [Candidatus Neomarinimicrobiota bacterium]